MTLPSYEEAMRTSSTIHHDHDHHANRYVWPMAPPPYDAVVSSSSSSAAAASCNPEPATAPAAVDVAAATPSDGNPPPVIHHRHQSACRSGQAQQDEQARVAELEEPIVCIDHRDDTEAGGAAAVAVAADAPSGSRENLVP